nr:GDT1-like protein 4 [Tanacetum cinerariifolium]
MKSRVNCGLLILLILIASTVVYAQDVDNENDEESSSRSIIDLGRRSKVVVETLKNNVKIDPKAVLELDTGLGVLDAFFASLSMILVSEADIQFRMCLVIT